MIIINNYTTEKSEHAAMHLHDVLDSIQTMVLRIGKNTLSGDELEKIDEELRQIGSIIHCAMVVADKLSEDLGQIRTWAKMADAHISFNPDAGSLPRNAQMLSTTYEN